MQAIAVATELRTLGSKGVWERCRSTERSRRSPQPAFNLSAQAEGGFTPAPRPNQTGYGYNTHTFILQIERIPEKYIGDRTDWSQKIVERLSEAERP